MLEKKKKKIVKYCKIHIKTCKKYFKECIMSILKTIFDIVSTVADAKKEAEMTSKMSDTERYQYNEIKKLKEEIKKSNNNK